MNKKVTLHRYNVAAAAEKVVHERGYDTVAPRRMFDDDGEPYCFVGSIMVELNDETRERFSGSIGALQRMVKQGYFEWADLTETVVVTAVLGAAMRRNDEGMTFGENLSKMREDLRDYARTHPASPAIQQLGGRVMMMHFIAAATGTE